MSSSGLPARLSLASEHYDPNFCFPFREFQNDRVKLTPFDPAIHAEAFWFGTKDHPEVYDYLRVGPFTSLDDFVAFFEQRFRSDQTCIVFAILDKTSSLLAGMGGFVSASPQNLSIEIGPVFCLPAFQSKGITASAISLLLQYALCLPSEGGLGLRRVQYQSDVGNKASIALAQKMGFRMEGIQRWQRVLAGHKRGNGARAREGDPLPGTKGQDTMVLSVCWDDWEDDVKQKVSVSQ